MFIAVNNRTWGLISCQPKTFRARAAILHLLECVCCLMCCLEFNVFPISTLPEIYHKVGRPVTYIIIATVVLLLDFYRSYSHSHSHSQYQTAISPCKSAPTT